jgi:hypothetical protein
MGFGRTRLQSIMSERFEMAMLQQAQLSRPIRCVIFILRYSREIVVTSCRIAGFSLSSVSSQIACDR